MHMHVYVTSICSYKSLSHCVIFLTDKVVLWPTFRIEKVTNTHNRAYVFELTTGDKYLCLSADEQRRMDIFVFILQSQMQLKKEIKGWL